jgi:hypothetical protein
MGSGAARPAMLVGMDIPAAAAAPWIVLGAVLGVLLLSAAGLAAYLLLRVRTPTVGASVAEEPSGPGAGDDDLPGFLESPPGSPGAPAVPVQGWAALTAASTPPAAAPAARRGRWDTVGVLAALTVAGALLIGIAAALAVASGSQDPPAPSARADGEQAAGLAAQLTFGGVVLERRAVGVTAAYPHLRLTSEGERTIAHVELPTFNCLTGEAPDDPVAAGCTAAGTEYAELATPALTVQRDDGGVRISGRFPTDLRPNGTPPVSTGRVYELEVTAEPTGEGHPGEWVPATGVLRLGDDRATTTGGPDDRLRFAD